MRGRQKRKEEGDGQAGQQGPSVELIEGLFLQKELVEQKTDGDDDRDVQDIRHHFFWDLMISNISLSSSWDIFCSLAK
jgi:hypothetical protein